MRLLLVRHGQTPANVDGVLESTVPGPGLTELGRQQAVELVPALADEPVDAVYVSTMVRTSLTIAPYLEASGLTSVERSGLREVSAGDREGRADEESIGVYVDTLMAWCHGDLDVRMPGAQTGRECVERFDEVVAEAEATGHETVVVVAHGAIIRLWCATRTTNVDGPFVSNHYVVNTGIVAVEGSSADGWEVTSWLGESVSEAAAQGVTADHSPASETRDATASETLDA